MKQRFLHKTQWVCKAVEGFKGAALEWYIKTYKHTVSTKWDEFIYVLERIFEPAGCTAILHQQLDCLTYKGHTFLDYITEF